MHEIAHDGQRLMACCGQGRAALRARAAAKPARTDAAPVAPPVAPPPAPQAAEPPAEGETTVVYVGDARLLVSGLASGRTYTFSPGRRVRHVPPDDGAALLLDALFERPRQ